jgi:DNA primase
MIKKLLTTKQVIEYYGFKVNRTGFVACPFHLEDTASLRVYDGSRGFHCFGCGATGSVIDFVMKLFNINYQQALTRLNYDFNLRLDFAKPDKQQMLLLKKERLAKAKNERLSNLIEMYYVLEFQINRRLTDLFRPTKNNPEITQEFAEAIVKMNDAEIWLTER